MSAIRHTAMDVADWFLRNPCETSLDLVTHLKLQKLVYYAQAWSLALRGEPLFEEKIEAWAHGPVVPSVYRAFARCGWDPLKVPEERAPFDFEPDVIDLLKEVSDAYGPYSAKHLEKMTHSETPWLEARGNIPPEARSRAEISKASMRAFYTELYERVGNEEEQVS